MEDKYYLATVELYEYTTVGVAREDVATNQKYSDVEFEKKSFKIFGTPEQVDEYIKPLPVDEIYRDKFENEDNSYYAGICFQYSKDHDMYNPESKLPTREEYNQNLQKRIDKIEKIYIERGRKVLIQ